MLNDSFTDLEHEIQPTKRRVAQLEVLDDAQGMQVVIKEEAVLLHDAVESFFSRMPKGRMPDVVGEGEGFHEIDIQTQLSGNRSRDLSNFNGVGQAISEMIRIASGKDLRLGLKPPKGTGMNDSVSVALEIVAIRVLLLGM